MTWDDPVRGLSGMIPQVKDCVKDLEVTSYGASDAIPRYSQQISQIKRSRMV